MFWVYILENVQGKFYVGQTRDLVKRLQDHNRTDCFEGHFTRKNGPWKLVWTETHDSRSSAVQRERQIKKMKSAKCGLHNVKALLILLPEMDSAFRTS